MNPLYLPRGGHASERTTSSDSPQDNIEVTTPRAENGELTNAMVPTSSNNESGPSSVVPVVSATCLHGNESDEDVTNFPLAATDPFPESPEEATLDRRPAFISVTVLKETRGADPGISVEQVEDRLRINHIDEEGLFGSTPLCVGDSVLSVNNTSCETKSAAFVSKLIQQSRRSVALLVHRPDGDPYIVSTMVTKPKPDSRVGIGLKVVNGCLCVSSIAPSGLFAGGILNVGDKCVSIGGVSCAFMDSTSAIELVRKEENVVSIQTWTEQEAGVVVAAVSEGRFWLSPWKRLLIMFLTGMGVVIISSYFLSEKNWVGLSTVGAGQECETLNGRPINEPRCKNQTRV